MKNSSLPKSDYFSEQLVLVKSFPEHLPGETRFKPILAAQSTDPPTTPLKPLHRPVRLKPPSVAPSPSDLAGGPKLLKELEY